MDTTENLSSYGNLSVGDRVIVPGHRLNDPDTHGTLVAIEKIQRPRSIQIWARVQRDSDGYVLAAAVGMTRKETA